MPAWYCSDGRGGCLEDICTEYRNMRYAGDWLFWIEQIKKGPIIEIHRKLNYFRKHQTNTTNQGDNEGNVLHEIFVIRKMLGRQICSTWKLKLHNKYGIYRLAYKWPVSSKQRRRQLLRQAAEIGGAHWWHYRLWKLYLSYRKHILRKPKLTFLDRIKG